MYTVRYLVPSLHGNIAVQAEVSGKQPLLAVPFTASAVILFAQNGQKILHRKVRPDAKRFTVRSRTGTFVAARTLRDKGYPVEIALMLADHPTEIMVTPLEDA